MRCDWADPFGYAWYDASAADLSLSTLLAIVSYSFACILPGSCLQPAPGHSSREDRERPARRPALSVDR